jgi:hypothetical protein
MLTPSAPPSHSVEMNVLHRSCGLNVFTFVCSCRCWRTCHTAWSVSRYMVIFSPFPILTNSRPGSLPPTLSLIARDGPKLGMRRNVYSVMDRVCKEKLFQFVKQLQVVSGKCFELAAVSFN